MIEENAKFKAQSYPMIINMLLKYIIQIKEKDKSISIMELILEYSMRNSLDIELVGDAISTDEYLKSILTKDLELHNYSTVKTINSDW